MLKGIGVSGGYGIGKVLKLGQSDLSFEPKTDCDPAAEKARFHAALEKFIEKNNASAEKLRKAVGEKEAEIVLGHILMIQDPYMQGEIEKLADTGMCAESAVSQICDMFAMIFSQADDELTRQRASDVNDIKNDLLSILLGRETPSLSELAPDTVICAYDLVPSVTAGLDREHVSAIVTETGGMTSHSAILARAMGIPAILGIPQLTETLKSGDSVIVDAETGCVTLSPTDDDIAHAKALQAAYAEKKRALAAFIEKKAETADGLRLEAAGNIGKPEEAAAVMQNGGDSVGLFRTEFLFMDREHAPTEDEQFEAYKKAALILKGKPLIVRTLDVGGDKDIPYLGLKKEDNPFLGFRAIRFCLAHTDLFKTQLRALLRAGVYGDIRIMLPLVTTVDEIKEARKLLDKCAAELAERGISYAKNIKLGIMVETPAASLCADMLAKHADFFSIGTNDLTQYTLTVDRGNPDVSYLYSVFSPAVLRSIAHIIRAANSAHIPVGMCGEAAADERLIPLLIAYGLDEFSVNPASLPSVKRTLSLWTKNDAKALAERIDMLETEREIREALEGAKK